MTTTYINCPDCAGMFTCRDCERDCTHPVPAGCEEHKALEALDAFDACHETRAAIDANPRYEEERSELVDALALADGTAERCENCGDVTEMRELLVRGYEGLCFGCRQAEHSRG